MSKSWKEIGEELTHLIREDEAFRTTLASTGELFHTLYHPAMEKIHLKHAQRLKEIIEEKGTFPTVDLVGEEACVAALRIVLHAISDPEFLRAQEGDLVDLARTNKVPKAYVANLVDRIRVYEGRKQVYGTYADWDENGIMRYPDVEDEEHLNERRASMDLEPLESLVITPLTGEFHPPNPQKHYQEFLEWTQKVGWRKT